MILQTPNIRIIGDALTLYIKFVLDHFLPGDSQILVLAAGQIRKRMKIDPNGQEYFEDIELDDNEIEDLKKAFAAFIASAQDIFCQGQRDAIHKLSTAIECLSVTKN